jgi:hypothetical protein
VQLDPVAPAGVEELVFVGEVPVDRQPSDAGFLGKSADGRSGGADGGMQLDRRLHDAVAGLLYELRSPVHPVRPRFNSTVLFTQLDTLPAIIQCTAVYIGLGVGSG